MTGRNTQRGVSTCRYAIVLSAAVLCTACSQHDSSVPPPMAFTGETMGTHYVVKVVSLPAAVSRQTIEDQIRQELENIDGLMSTYRPDSELSKLNRFDRTDKWFDVSAETAMVLEEAVQIGRLSGGAFDVTVGPLVNLWSFGPDGAAAESVPSAAEIEAVAARVGFENLELRTDPPAVRKKRADLYIDLSGIAKGFAVDRVAECLERHRIQDYLVEVGGEVRAKGHNHLDVPWRIGVESPVAGIREVQRKVALQDLAMATSGDYRNYFEKDGVRYSHIIDPRSGRPVAHRLASATVFDPSCTRADALATALMVLGPEAGFELARREKLAVLLIVRTDHGFLEKTTAEFEKVKS